MKTVCCTTIIAILAACLGCNSRKSVVPISGVVTLDGKPLANAHVAFQPNAKDGEKSPGPGSYGVTDANGAYSLKVMDNDEPGAVVANHRVEIKIKQESDDRDPRLRPPPKVLPPRYNLRSELQFNVEPGGSKAANFDLKSQ